MTNHNSTDCGVSLADVVIHRDNGSISRISEGWSTCQHGGGLTEKGMRFVDAWLGELTDGTKIIMRSMRVPAEAGEAIEGPQMLKEVHCYADHLPTNYQKAGRA
jgi:hypothetical protein